EYRGPRSDRRAGPRDARARAAGRATTLSALPHAGSTGPGRGLPVVGCRRANDRHPAHHGRRLDRALRGKPMLLLLSPAKKLDYDTPVRTTLHTQPLFAKEAAKLIAVLKEKSAADIAKLMKLSDALAELNVQRYQEWKP